jgi:hypothetical protein
VEEGVITGLVDDFPFVWGVVEGGVEITAAGDMADGKDSRFRIIYLFVKGGDIGLVYFGHQLTEDIWLAFSTASPQEQIAQAVGSKTHVRVHVKTQSLTSCGDTRLVPLLFYLVPCCRRGLVCLHLSLLGRPEVPRSMRSIAREASSSVCPLYNSITRGRAHTRRHCEDQAGCGLVYLSYVVHGGELLVTWVVETCSSQDLRLCR